MRVYEDKKLSDQSFVVEEVVFIRCHLKNCDLFYSGGDFEWAETQFENCRFRWRGPSKNTLAMLQGLGLLKAPAPGQPQIPPTVGQKAN
jgi:hypothetical protein